MSNEPKKQLSSDTRAIIATIVVFLAYIVTDALIDNMTMSMADWFSFYIFYKLVEFKYESDD